MVNSQNLVDRYSIFNHVDGLSPIVSNNVANHWFNFSSFVPDFLFEISESINSSEIKSRILAIVQEEKGDGFNTSHSQLFHDAMTAVGFSPAAESVTAIENLKKKYSAEITFYNQEAYAIGVSFGLEIIAEENIQYLLSLTSPTEEQRLKNVSSLFFKIHLVNEKDHIEKCQQNVSLVSPENESSLNAGIALSLSFWKDFWSKAVCV